jgi:hypothetical protein
VDNARAIILIVIFVLGAYYAMTIPFLLILLPVVGYKRIRLRGYAPAKAAALISGALLASILATIAAAVLLPKHLGELRIVLLCAAVLILSLAFGYTALVRKLPKRTLRVGGPRRVQFPFLFFGYLLIAIGIATVIAVPILAPPENRTIGNYLGLPSLLMVFILFGTVLLRIGKRVKNQRSIEETVPFDVRSPVLFLRPFAAEGLPFVQGLSSKYDRYSSETQELYTSLRSMSDADGDKQDEDPTVSITFEVYLGPALQEQIGPFIALGNPEDYLPPQGATRTYFEDEDWFEYFQRMARQSVCMVMPISNSDNLQRELIFLRSEGLQRRLFLFTPLWSQSQKRVVFPARAADWLVSQLYGISRQQDSIQEWKHLSETLQKLGLDLEENPGQGAVITFDSEGKATVLARGADLPADFVDPVREHLISTFGPINASPQPPDQIDFIENPLPETQEPTA